MGVFALSRLPGLMPENFSAAYALAFCAGAFFPGQLAWWLPLGTLLATDLFLNFFFYGAQWTSPGPLVEMLAPNYLAYLGLIWMGKKCGAKASWFKLVGGGLLGAVLFYLVSNTGAWLANPEYAKTLAGWIQALTVGTPGWPHTWEFFRNTLLSGGLFTGLFAGAMKAAEALEPETEAEEEPAAEAEEGETEESPA